VQTIQSGGGSYAPGNTVTLATGTVAATLGIVSTQVASATINAPGTGGTNGTGLVFGTDGTGQKFVLRVVVSGGALSSVAAIVYGGDYTANPTLAAAPVSGLGLTGATIAVKTGPRQCDVTVPGVYASVPSGPIAQGSTSGAGTGATFNVVTETTGTYYLGTDNSTALQNWLDYGELGNPLALPIGMALFATPLTAPTPGGMTVSGVASGLTTLVYTGSSLTASPLTIGTSGTASNNVNLANFDVTPAPAMQSGSATVRLYDLQQSHLTNIRTGAPSFGKSWNGIRLSGFNIVTIDGMSVGAQNEAFSVNGDSGDGLRADLWLRGTEVGHSRVGIHVGGSAGGVYLYGVDSLMNYNNLLVDQGITGSGNYEIDGGSSFYSDTTCTDYLTACTPSTGGDGILWNDASSSGYAVFRGEASIAGGSGFHIVQWGGSLRISPMRIGYNSADGIRSEDKNTILYVSPDAPLIGNSGYGVDCTVPATTTITGVGYSTSNGSGGVSADCAGLDMPGRPRLVVLLKNSDQSLSTGIGTLVEFDTVTTDDDAGWVTTGPGAYGYQPNVSGTYAIRSCVTSGGTFVAGTDFALAIDLDGSAIATSYLPVPTITGTGTTCAATISYLNGAGDELSVTGTVTASTPVFKSGAGYVSYLAINRIGP
jgi:hypothetical protein